jgi:hypothetical protein
MNLDTLTSLLWWVVIGGLFFWMMRRGGCGMMAHGHGGTHGAEPSEPPSTRRVDQDGRSTVMSRLDGKVLGAAMGMFLAIAYVTCVAYDLVFHQTMYRVWTGLLPGFVWISWESFFLGLAETLVFGLFFGLIFAPLYNFFLVKVWRYAP